MKKRHKYEYKIDINNGSAAAAVIRMVGMNKRVLELGAGPGSMTRILRDHNNCKVSAIEIDENAIEKLFPVCEHVYQCNLNDHAWHTLLSNDGKFEVVIAADVLEHLNDPSMTLNIIKKVLDVEGYVVVSLPHICHNSIIACLFQENWECNDWGLLDKTHIRFFGIKNIQQLFDNTGFEIVEAEFIVIPPEQTEFANHWNYVHEDLKKLLTNNRFGNVYQFVIKARPSTLPRHGLKLSSLSVPDPSSISYTPASFKMRIIRFIRKIVLPRFSLHTRSQIRNILYRIGIRY